MKKQEYIQPDFLLAEIAVKDGTPNDQRLWVYHRLSLSLIKFINVNGVDDFRFEGTQEVFLYGDEEWIGVYVQNNAAVTNNDEMAVLRAAWDYFRTYLVWEDKGIDKDKIANQN